MNNLSTGALTPTGEILEKAAQLNKLSEVSQVALGMCLVKIKEEKLYEGQYSTFDEYYKAELGRTKSDISKLLTVGRFMLEGGFPEETDVGYTKLYVALGVFPDKDPNYILAAAESNTIAEMLQNRTDDAFGTDHQHILEEQLYKKCSECGKMERV